MSQRTVDQTAQVAPAVRPARSLAGHVKAAVLPMSERIKSDGLVQPLRSPGSPAPTVR